MANKPKFTKESVIEAGMVQLMEAGWEGLTPKKVAQRLGASTMPIFSHFATMAEFKEALMDRAWDQMAVYARKTFTGDPWVDQGIGYVLFARDHGRLFTAMHSVDVEAVQERRYQFWVMISRDLADYPAFKGMDPELVGWMRNLRSFLTYGIAVSVNSGLTPAWENDEVIQRMVKLCSEVLYDGLPGKAGDLKQTLELIPPGVRERVSGIKLE